MKAVHSLVAKHGLRRVIISAGVSILVLFLAVLYLVLLQKKQINILNNDKQKLSNSLSSTQKSYIVLKKQDQYKINQQLKKEIDQTHRSYKDSITVYQGILDLRVQKQDTSKLDTLYADLVSDLSDLNYSSADANLKDLSGQIKTINDKLAAAAAAAVNAPAGSSQPPPVSNSAPGSGFNQQSVQTDTGTFTVDIIAADLNSTRVIVDTASGGDCSNNCPVLPLADYVARNGAYAGINGSFFCPVDYPSCAGKTGSFDTLLMNKNKVYFNSSNNVYSTVPAAIFSGGSARFVTQSLQWGRDTGVDAVIAMQPGLIFGGQIAYSGSSDPKFESRGPRGFIANKGGTVYIGDVLNATMNDSAHVLHTLSMDNAINLDEGGSTALWFGGYRLGPSRNIPNAVLFVKR